MHRQSTKDTVGAYRREALAREELQQREETLQLFRFTIDHTADSVIWIGGDGRILYANGACEQSLGYSNDELLRLHAWDIDPTISEESWRGHWTELESSDVLTTESEYLASDGRLVPIEVTYSCVSFADRASLCAIFRDVTIRKRIEAAVRESELRLRSIVRNAGDGIVTLDDAGTIDSVNPATEEIFGYQIRELVGRNLSLLLPPADGNDTSWFLKVADAAGGAAARLPNVNGRHKDGSSVPLDVALTETDVDERRIYTVIIHDVSEQRDAAEKLQAHAQELARSNAELEQFAYVASHDLQEPLRMVASYVQLLERRYRDRLDEDASTFIRYAADGATRMQELIRDLLSFSRVQRKGKPLVPSDANAVLDDVLAILSVAIEDSGAQITADSLPSVMADPGQLAQVIQNLIANALKFRGDRRPEIHVAATPRDEYVEISVSDNGIGIDPRFFERIFAIFQRLHTRANYEGTGIGLAITKKIVERHGGRIWLESTPGEGTIFHFTLLLADQEEKAFTEPGRVPPQQGGFI